MFSPAASIVKRSENDSCSPPATPESSALSAVDPLPRAREFHARSVKISRKTPLPKSLPLFLLAFGRKIRMASALLSSHFDCGVYDRVAEFDEPAANEKNQKT
jgi:hypothetical protein